MARIEFGAEARMLGIGPEAHKVVYFIQSASTRAIKIGSSTGPKRRLFVLQCAHDAELTLLGTTEQYQELELHRKFASIRLRGEWFKPESELLEFLSSLGIATMQTFADVRAATDKPSEDMTPVGTRSDIIYAIMYEVWAWKMPRREAARRLGITQVRLDDLLKGKVERFSFDVLLTLAERVGLDVQVTVTRRP